nr:MAG TPA: hypothetical protein [Caudoviricetes sp.]
MTRQQTRTLIQFNSSFTIWSVIERFGFLVYAKGTLVTKEPHNGK